jgi:hypothetical protein
MANAIVRPGAIPYLQMHAQEPGRLVNLGASEMELRPSATALIWALRVEINEEIQPPWGETEPGQQQRCLTTVLGGMVDLVQELLPERIGPRLTLKVHVGDDTR